MAKKYTHEQAMADAAASIAKRRGRKKNSKAAACTCKNHMGSAKQLYATKAKALDSIIRNHMWTGKTYSVYQCPTTKKFHVTGKGRLNA